MTGSARGSDWIWLGALALAHLGAAASLRRYAGVVSSSADRERV